MDARIFDEPKIDCHVHVLDPGRFPYRADTHYAPAGPEALDLRRDSAHNFPELSEQDHA